MFAHIPAIALWGSYEMTSSIFRIIFNTDVKQIFGSVAECQNDHFLPLQNQ